MENKVIKIGEEWLNNLRFADDVIITGKNMMKLKGTTVELIEKVKDKHEKNRNTRKNQN